MPRAIVAGHICLDIIPDLPGDLRIEPGRLVQSGPAQISTGGVVSNTGLALKKLNVDVGLVGKVGRDLFGQAILDRLAGSAQHMIVSAREASSYTIVVNLAGKDRMFLHCPGCNDSFRSLDVSDEVLREADFFHFGYPSLMKQMFEQDGDELVDLFRRARAAGVTTSLDVSLPDPGSPAGKANWKRILERVLPFCDLFMPNLDEARFMIGSGDPPTLARQIQAMGAKIAGIKLGANGIYLSSISDLHSGLGRGVPNWTAWRSLEIWASAFEIQVRGTTGAGDATMAGLIRAMLAGEDPSTAADEAVAVGAFCCESPDATSGICSLQDLKSRIDSGWPRRTNQTVL